MKETTILLCTPDSNSEITKRCLDSIFQNTDNNQFELRIYDNRWDPSFSHPRDINRCLKSLDTDYLVSLDDDVILTPGWLDALLEGVDDSTGLVGSIQLNRDGSIRHSGGWVSRQGIATHFREHLTEPALVPYICSACVLLTQKDLLFSEEYSKYCQETDYCLRLLENDLKIKVVPHKIYHIGNQQMLQKHTRDKVMAISASDQSVFVKKWVETNRINRLYEKCFETFTHTIEEDTEYQPSESGLRFRAKSLDDTLNDNSKNIPEKNSLVPEKNVTSEIDISDMAVSYHDKLTKLRSFVSTNNISTVSILGAGKNGQLLYGMFSALGVKIDAIYDDYANQTLGIHTPRNLESLKDQSIPLIVSILSNSKHHSELISRVKALGVKYWQVS